MKKPKAGLHPADAEGTNEPPLWRNFDYVGWWTGNTISALGTSVSAIAYPLLVLSQTGSVAKAGLIGSANLIGILVTTLWGGVLADRASRRAILVAGPLVQAVVLGSVAALVVSGHTELPVLVASALLSGLCSGVVLGASTPALARIVPAERLPAANGQAMARDMAAQLLGSPLGGLLFAAAAWVPFLSDGVSFVFAALGALNIRTPLGPDRTQAQPRTSMTQDAGEGIRFVRNQPFLRFVVVMASVLNMINQAFVLLLIGIVVHRGGNSATVGICVAMTVAGGLIGSLFAAKVTAHVPARAVLCGGISIFTASVVAIALVPATWQIAAVVCVAEVATVPANVVLQSYVIRMVPDQLLGRVAAVNRFGAYSLEWAGPLLAGLLTLLFGASGGMLSLLIVLAPLTAALAVARALNVLSTPLKEVTPLAVRGAEEAAKSAQIS